MAATASSNSLYGSARNDALVARVWPVLWQRHAYRAVALDQVTGDVLAAAKDTFALSEEMSRMAHAREIVPRPWLLVEVRRSSPPTTIDEVGQTSGPLADARRGIMRWPRHGLPLDSADVQRVLADMWSSLTAHHAGKYVMVDLDARNVVCAAAWLGDMHREMRERAIEPPDRRCVFRVAGDSPRHLLVPGIDLVGA